MAVKKLSAEFIIEKNYRRPGETTPNDRSVSVKLIVDFKTHNYRIKPDGTDSKDGFVFSNSISSDPDKWEAILSAIKQAIDLGEAELAADRNS